MIYPKSQALFEQAKNKIPGGVNSPARAFKAVGGTPLFFKQANGALLFDEDGHTYIDYVASWGPMILGHRFPPVVKAVQEAATHSLSFGAPVKKEIEMAERVCHMVPGLQKVRMVNSGTEACMSAVRVARGYTGRDKVIKFEGCYHGHGDAFLIKAGSGALTLGHPSSPGVTRGTAKDTLNATFNDPESVRHLMEAYRGEVAAVILEPVAGNMGCVPPKKEFLQKLRRLCDTHGALLIYDEVMTGFRIARGGAVERYGVQPDLITFGKILGAGMPVGAFGGKSEVMNVVAPDGPVYQAGTLSGNPVSMSAGLALLNELDKNPSIYNDLEEKSERLQGGIMKVFEKHGVTVTTQRVGSMMGFFFCKGPVSTYSEVTQTDTRFFAQFFHGMLRQGVYLPPSAFETWFVSHAHDDETIQKTIEAVDATLSSMAEG